MSQEHEQEKESKREQKDTLPGAAIITWERPRERVAPSKSEGQVISIDDYRRQGLSESEATFNVREFPSSQGEEPVRLVIISSGFGQKQPAYRHTLQSRAVA
ncbi:hypothetical protein P5G65_12215 [Paenibacillus chondroitinus]|uniref:Uncharacterized protein n=1 Tax=Paenibacillus chondroitinus TaxID=59842 RepID=A0ABU6DAG7_9BACL|nr:MULTISPECIES: hypothetical protein [Paenibacillus]MCY9662298.1 hypothetical protein [Paenibacillus anseongense]MEB4794664.1 hypothetical protein [Paenibacillus chondroitinus]